MTQNKELLLKDLSARVPYGTKVKDDSEEIRELLGVIDDLVYIGYDINDYDIVYVEDIKPYLRPVSSMTEEERNEYFNIIKNTIDFYNCPKSEDICFLIILIDWLNAHHFDYRGLIDKGLASVAPEGMY